MSDIQLVKMEHDELNQHVTIEWDRNSAEEIVA